MKDRLCGSRHRSRNAEPRNRAHRWTATDSSLGRRLEIPRNLPTYRPQPLRERLRRIDPPRNQRYLARTRQLAPQRNGKPFAPDGIDALI